MIVSFKILIYLLFKQEFNSKFIEKDKSSKTTLFIGSIMNKGGKIPIRKSKINFASIITYREKKSDVLKW